MFWIGAIYDCQSRLPPLERFLGNLGGKRGEGYTYHQVADQDLKDLGLEARSPCE